MVKVCVNYTQWNTSYTHLTYITASPLQAYQKEQSERKGTVKYGQFCPLFY